VKEIKMTDIQKVIEQDDQKLKLRENELINKINDAYDRAITAARKEFKALEAVSENKKVSSQEVKRILKKTMTVFKKEYDTLIEPIQKMTLECYEEGLEETGKILKELKGERNDI